MALCKWQIGVVIVMVCAAFTSVSAQDENKYVVFFKDKAGSPYGLEQADQFLSAEARYRRERFNIPLNDQDLPLSDDYLEDLEDLGFTLYGQSRWLNAVLVSAESPDAEEDLNVLPYVRKVIWAALETMGGRQDLIVDGVCIEDASDFREELFWQAARETSYGFSSNQVRMLNGQFLHNNGWQGEAMTIAVLDAGFRKTDELVPFYSLMGEGRIIETYDFVDYDDEVFESSGHGTSVLSTMAARLDDLYLGTAPNANYILLKTEDIKSEQIVEEFNYVLGLEHADQFGADVINTSLGYTRYNHPEMDHEPEELDGDHLIASIGGDIAASKGMIVVNSAGNEGGSSWMYTSIPADGDSILAVGSVNVDRVRSDFSGIGWPEVENIKPNVMAQGEGSAVFNTNGEIVLSSGTSFSAPIVAGLTACLWQAFPERTNMEILAAVEQSSSQFLNPDKLSGYGIPDFQAAYALLYQEDVSIDLLNDIQVFPNPFSTNITLTLPESPDQDMRIHLVNDIGQVLFEKVVDSGSRKTVNLYFNGVRGLNMGLYFLKIKTAEEVFVFKLIKV